jgi:hypothetical protein
LSFDFDRNSFGALCRRALAIIRQARDRAISGHWVGILLGPGVDAEAVLRSLAWRVRIERAGEIRPGEVAWIACEWGGAA